MRDGETGVPELLRQEGRFILRPQEHGTWEIKKYPPGGEHKKIIYNIVLGLQINPYNQEIIFTIHFVKKLAASI